MNTVKLIFIHEKTKESLYLLDWPAQGCGVPGLVICPKPTPVQSDEDRPIYWTSGGVYGFTYDRLSMGYNWQILHRRSGIVVFSGYLTKAEAMEIAKNLAGVDWTVEASEIEANPAYGETVRKATNERYKKFQEAGR